MRATLGVLASLCVASVAHAGTRIVLMTGSDDATALQVAMAGRGAEIAMAAPPDGELRLDRAAIVQRAAVDARALAGVWIEQDPGSAEVCVVSADGKVFRHAPLPVDAGARVFAAIATSLLDEIVTPQRGEVDVDVDVHVDLDVAPRGAVATIDAPHGAPGFAAPGIAMSAPEISEGVVRADRIQLEVGPMLSPLTLGLEAEATMPISDRLRAGALAGASMLFSQPATGVFIGAAELRYVGRGTKHNDLGVISGASVVQGGVAPFVGVRFQRVWEHAGSGISLSINPVLALVDTVGPKVYPGLWTSLRWELPI